MMKKIKRNFFEITVKSVIVNEKNEVLLVKRSKNSEYGVGKYDLPGGKLEAGENIKEGLTREIEEEIGIEVDLGPILYVFDFEKKYDKKYEIGDEELLISGKGIRFLAYYRSGKIALSDEHDQHEWMEMDKAIEKFGKDDFEKDKKVAIKRAKEYLEMKNALEGWKRCQADFENYKKRISEERRDMIAYANINLISEILPVLDNFYASTEHIPDGQKENAWVEGIMYIRKQLEKVLKDNGVEEIAVKKGDKFDPEKMEALEDKECEPEECRNVVKKVVQRGYGMGGKMLRAARVIVE